MILRRNIYVQNPLKEEWGVGKVLEDVGNNVYEVFFINAGLKKFNKKQNPLVQVENVSEELFENLNTDKNEKFTSTSDLIEYFLKNYENGFDGIEYKNKEREYKDKAKNLANELLSKSTFENLLAENDFEEITKRALKLINSTNLIFPNEKMSLKDGLAVDEKKEEFSKLLFQLLYNTDEESSFNSFCIFLESINSDKWTIVSYFQFFIHSDNHIFIKPSITQSIAEIAAYNIEYTPKLNWNTYSKVQKFANYLKNNIESLNPKDMIDVQSFIWCVSEKYTK